MRKRYVSVVVGLAALLPLVVSSATPAHAVDTNVMTGNLEFMVNGTLSPFPGTLRSTSFNGTGSGAGTINGIGSDGGVYHADVTVLAMNVYGDAIYNEPIWPICPLVGSAFPMNGVITMHSQPGSISGIAYRAGDALTGSVTGISTTFVFQYNRVGANATIAILSASVTAYMAIPGHGTPSITADYVGGGTGAFIADPVEAEQLCRGAAGTDGALDYTLVGDVTVGG